MKTHFEIEAKGNSEHLASSPYCSNFVFLFYAEINRSKLPKNTATGLKTLAS